MTTIDINPTSYWDAQACLSNTTRRKLAPNTYAERLDDETIGITLYATRIVTYYSGGLVELDSGGHVTALTAERMNRYTPEGVNVRRKAGALTAEVDGPHNVVVLR